MPYALYKDGPPQKQQQMKNQLTRRGFIKSCSMGIAGLSASSLLTGCQSKNRPNILWIISEDTSPDLSCYGHPLVKTPHIDQMASEGTLFTHAFASCPVCSPARSALMTGMYQTSIGAHQHRTRDKKYLEKPLKVITEYFRQAGYFTVNVTTPAPDVPGTGKTDWNFLVNQKPYDGTDWNQREETQPFFAMINLRLTHRPFEKDVENPINPEDIELPPMYPDVPLSRRDWADYLESLQVLDRQIGQILFRLKTEELEDNTIVFYFGDHGRPHVWDKQWLYDGGIRIPLIVRWPGHIKKKAVDDTLVSLIDIGPTAMTLSGISVPPYLEGRSFMKRNGQIAGKRDYIVAARDRCDETDDRIRCIRTKSFKYIRNFHPETPYTQFNAYKKNQYPVVSLLQVLHEQGKLTPQQAKFLAPNKPKEELYDLRTDPFELNNLADNIQYESVLSNMRTILINWIEITGDRGEIPESQEEKEYWDSRMALQFKKWMDNKGLSEHANSAEHLKFWESKFLGK